MPRGHPGTTKALVAAIRAHLQELKRVVQDASALRMSAQQGESTALRALGSLLHDFYTGAEAIFQLMDQDVMPTAPDGDRRGTRTLARSPAVGGEESLSGAVLSQPLLEALDDYRRFRQIFRSVYGHRLQYRRIEPLVDNLPCVYRRLKEELEAFLAAIHPSVCHDGDGDSLEHDPHHSPVDDRCCFPQVAPGGVPWTGGGGPLS